MSDTARATTMPTPPTPRRRAAPDRWTPRRLHLPSERILARAAALEEIVNNAPYRYATRRRPFWPTSAGSTADAGDQVIGGLPRSVALDLVLTPVTGRDLALASWASGISRGSRLLLPVIFLTAGLPMIYLYVATEDFVAMGVWMAAGFAGVPSFASGALNAWLTRVGAKSALRAERARGPLAILRAQLWRYVCALAGPVTALFGTVCLLASGKDSNLSDGTLAGQAAVGGMCVGLVIDYIARKKFDANLAAAARDFDALLEAMRERGPLK